MRDSADSVVVAAALLAVVVILSAINDHAASIDRAQWRQAYWIEQQTRKCGP